MSMKKYVVVRKIEKVVVVSGSRRGLQDLQLGARHCDVGLNYVEGVVAGSKACRPIAGYSAVQAYKQLYGHIIGIYRKGWGGRKEDGAGKKGKGRERQKKEKGVAS